MSSTRPILVTGIHRSGTTWLGRMLEQAPGLRYLYEPFNDEIDASLYGRVMPTSFTYVCKENEEEYFAFVKSVLRGSWKTQVKSVIQPKRVVWKDPHAFFSAPWMHETFDMNVVVIIRHPAAFILSIIDKNWPYDFNNLLQQPLLMKNELVDYSEAIHSLASAEEDDIIAQGCLLWNIIYERAQAYQAQYPNWSFIKHEEIASDPGPGFEQLFQNLALPFPNEVRNRILEYSAPGQSISADQSKGNTLKRDSKALTQKWKKRLSQEDVSRIRALTEASASHYYSPDSWE